MPRALVVGLGLVALAVVAVLVAVPVLIQRNLSVEAVEERATALAGRPVRVESVGITFRPGLRIRAEGVVVEGGSSADAIEVEIAVLPLLRRRVEPSELHLRGARLPVQRDRDGGLRLLLMHRPGRDGSGGGFPALPALEARDGELFLVDASGAPTDAPVLDILRFEQAPLRAEGRTPVRLDVAVAPGAPGRPGVARMRLEGFVERDGNAIRVRDGRVRADDLAWKGLRFQGFEGRFEYAAGRVDVERLVLTGYESAVSFTGSVRPASPARIDGTWRAEGLDLSALIADLRGRAPDPPLGALDFDAQVALILRSVGSGTGQASLRIQGGQLPAASLFGSLLGAIGRLTGRVLGLGADAAPAPSQVERIAATWELRGDRLHTTDLEVVTDDYRYAAAGSIGLDQTLAISGQLQLSNRGAQRMVASAALPFGGSRGLLPEIPVEVAGTLGAPNVTARATALPGTATSALVGLIPGGGTLVKGAADAGKSAAEVGTGAVRAGKKTIEKVLGR